MMTRDQKIKMRTAITEYAGKALEGIDPQRTKISFQLEKLRPEMERLAKEYGKTLDEIFIIYMDMNSELKAEEELRFQNEMKEAMDR